MLDKAEERKTLRYILDYLFGKYKKPTKITIGEEDEDFIINTEVDSVVSVDRLRNPGYTSIKPCEILYNHNKVSLPIIFK